jgi:hypothetical protein
MATMESANVMDAHQLGELARFLDDHPAFSPTFSSDDAILCGFRVGNCFVTMDEMEYLLHAPEESHEPALVGAYTEWAGGI